MSAGKVCFSDANVEIRQVITGPLDNNVYFIRCTSVRCMSTNQAVMVEAPGGDPDLLVHLCHETGVEVVLISHGHHDHVGAIRRLRSKGLRVGIGGGDTPMLRFIDFTINDGDEFDIGDVKVLAISTPGHTPGSMCFAVGHEPVLLSGDTLFPGGPGATDKPYSDFDTIIASVTKLFALFDDSTLVLPGHGRPTTIGAERPHLNEWIARRW